MSVIFKCIIETPPSLYNVSTGKLYTVGHPDTDGQHFDFLDELNEVFKRRSDDLKYCVD